MTEFAIVNVTWDGLNGDLPDLVSFQATNQQVINWVTEAVRSGSVNGIPAYANADFSSFHVDRFEATDNRATGLFQVRPKTPFGS